MDTLVRKIKATLLVGFILVLGVGTWAVLPELAHSPPPDTDDGDDTVVQLYVRSTARPVYIYATARSSRRGRFMTYDNTRNPPWSYETTVTRGESAMFTIYARIQTTSAYRQAVDCQIFSNNEEVNADRDETNPPKRSRGEVLCSKTIVVVG